MKNKKSLSKTSKILMVNLAAGVLFSLFSINFIFDISLFAFPIAIFFSVLVSFFTYKVVKNKDGKVVYICRKLCEYYPYVLFISFIFRRAGKNGTQFWYDIITVILWVVVFVLSFVISSILEEKNVLEYADDFEIKPVAIVKAKGGVRVLTEAVEWIDALVQAIFGVLILQIFLFQLYEIPSESMVPTFLIKDKVIVSKIECGPKFPLTDVGLPDIRKYKRGDTIVLRNPHYTLDRKSEVKTVTSQLIYMLTIMQVNLNRDSDGELKADPLVKRITGLPGEQLVMQDGTLYSRTKDHDFEPVEKDATYAAWNLNTLKSKTKKKVQHIPLSAQEYEEMLNFEEFRRNYDLNAAVFQANELVRKFEKLSYKDNLSGKFTAPSMFEYTLFGDVQNLTRQLMCQEGGVQWFNSFMTSWIPTVNEKKDIYAESNYKLNVMTKITLGNLIVRYAELYRNNISASMWNSDAVLRENNEMAAKLTWYIQMILDERNMPVFPANDVNGDPQFIPKNCYFMMGDNRFNSLDLRHRMEQDLEPLSSYDALSVEYYSMMQPQYINKKYIVGKPIYIFMPAGRVGRV